MRSRHPPTGRLHRRCSAYPSYARCVARRSARSAPTHGAHRLDVAGATHRGSAWAAKVGLSRVGLTLIRWRVVVLASRPSSEPVRSQLRESNWCAAAISLADRRASGYNKVEAAKGGASGCSPAVGQRLPKPWVAGSNPVIRSIAFLWQSSRATLPHTGLSSYVHRGVDTRG